MIVPLYTALLSLMFVILSLKVIFLRRKKGIKMGVLNDSELARAVRVHSNFVEYVPLILLLLFFLEMKTNEPVLLHILCIVLLLGRILHAYGLSQVNENLRFRIVGMMFTLGAMISAAIRLLFSYL